MLVQESDRIRPDTPMEFLRTELAVAQVYASLAEGQSKLGHSDAADRSLIASENSYQLMRRVLSELSNTMQINITEAREMMIETERLRNRLDLLKHPTSRANASAVAS